MSRAGKKLIKAAKQARKIVGGVTFECIGGTKTEAGETNGPCFGHFAGPDCPYCRVIATDIKPVSLEEALEKAEQSA